MATISIDENRKIYETCSTHYFVTSHRQQLAISLLMMMIRKFSKEDVESFLTENGIPLEKKEYRKYEHDYKWNWKGKYMKEINAGDFKLAVLDESIKVPIIIDFWAPWCGPCKAQAPLLEQIAHEYKDKLHIYSVNVDENHDLMNDYQIRGLPTLLIFRNGKPVERMVGLQSKNNILAQAFK
jgi:thioredoxin 1